jgi:hypothetical protein
VAEGVSRIAARVPASHDPVLAVAMRAREAARCGIGLEQHAVHDETHESRISQLAIGERFAGQGHLTHRRCFLELLVPRRDT